MRRWLRLFAISAIGTFVATAFSQFLWENQAIYYLSNGYDVPGVLSWAMVAPPIAVVVAIGMTIRNRRQFLVAWLTTSIFSVLGPLTGKPSFAFADDALVTIWIGVLMAVLLAAGQAIAWLARRIRRRQLMVVCS